MIIYKVTNNINNKIYIGQTKYKANQRLNKHYTEAVYEQNHNIGIPYFHQALLKYGKENFSVEVIDTAETKDELNEKEQYWISFYNSMDRTVGYNSVPGGNDFTKSPESRAIMSEKKKKNWEDPEFAEKALAGLRKGTRIWQEQSRNNRVTFICPVCGKEMKVPLWESRKRRYCSSRCNGLASNGLKFATIRNKQIAEERHKSFLKEVEVWIQLNENLIKNCQYNKISTTLIELQNIALKYNFKDWRVISKIICGKPSKKELLSYLKEKIC